jgi:RNA polymerase sigma factor (TIGR02999 family)
MLGVVLRGLSARPVWELDAGLGLSGGREGRFPGETAGSHRAQLPAYPELAFELSARTLWPVSEVTRILDSIAQGDPEAAEKLLRLVYEELRRLAAHKMAAEAPGHTLQPTELVHEAWLRLTAGKEPHWENHAHFFAAAAEAMRRILVQRARKRTASKRGGGAERVSLDEMEIPMVVVDEERLLAVDEALDKLAASHPRKAQLVKLRYFTGMTFEEAASILGIAVPTAKEWWAYARAWLAVELRQSI